MPSVSLSRKTIKNDLPERVIKSVLHSLSHLPLLKHLLRERSAEFYLFIFEKLSGNLQVLVHRKNEMFPLSCTVLTLLKTAASWLKLQIGGMHTALSHTSLS